MIVESYPRDNTGYNDLGTVYGDLGQYDKATEVTRQAKHLMPDKVDPYANLANYLLAMQRFDEARQTIKEARARKLDNFSLNVTLYALAFLSADMTALQQQQQWFASWRARSRRNHALLGGP